MGVNIINNNSDNCELTTAPFYLPQFEKAFRYIIDEYEVKPADIAIFVPCAVRKPYSQSPSHKLFHKVFDSVFPDKSKYHLVIFGTCGVVPSELELMYPFAHYHYMLGKVKDQKVKDDFLEIETKRLCTYFEKTKDTYKYRTAYCLGLFRKAMEAASAKAGVDVEIYPTEELIGKLYNPESSFPQGSLSMQEYLDEFADALTKIRDRR